MKTPPRSAWTVDIENSTLGDLRAAVAMLEGVPDDHIVRARTTIRSNSHGARIRRIHIEQEDS